MARLAHTMIRILDEARSLAFYETAFGLKVVERAEFDAFVLIYLRDAEQAFELELTVIKDRKEPWAHGESYGHMAVTVDDLDAEHARLTAAGVQLKPIRELMLGDRLFARYCFVTDPDGYKIEVLERSGRFG